MSLVNDELYKTIYSCVTLTSKKKRSHSHANDVYMTGKTAHHAGHRGHICFCFTLACEYCSTCINTTAC